MTTKARKVPTRLAGDKYDGIAGVLRVLGHPDRLRLVDILMRRDAAVGELADLLDLPPNVVSQHLSNMLAHRIVRRQRRGRQVFYDVVHPAAQNLLQCIWRNEAQL